MALLGEPDDAYPAQRVNFWKAGHRLPNRDERREINRLAGGPTQRNFVSSLLSHLPEEYQRDMAFMTAMAVAMSGNEELGLLVERLQMDGAGTLEVMAVVGQEAVKAEVWGAAFGVVLFKLRRGKGDILVFSWLPAYVGVSCRPCREQHEPLRAATAIT